MVRAADVRPSLRLCASEERGATLPPAVHARDEEARMARGPSRGGSASSSSCCCRPEAVENGGGSVDPRPDRRGERGKGRRRMVYGLRNTT